MLTVGAAAIVCWMFLCGQGGVIQQLADWAGRNAQLNDLVSYSWPPYYSDGSAFVYYMGHFLVPAVFGKIFGLGAARAVLFIYTATAVYITWLYLIKILKADTWLKQIGILVLLMFFGSAEPLRIIVNDLIAGIFHTSRSYITYGFTSNSIAYGGVFNQICCAFIVLSVLFDDDSKIENFAALGVPMLLYSPFMLIGVFIIAAVMIVKQFVNHKDNILSVIKRLFNVQNLCALVVLFPIILLYLSGNVFAEKPDELGLHAVSYGGRISVYIIFVLCEFLIYSICVFPRFKKNAYFYAANAILLLLPFFTMGTYNDLVTRCSSVGLYVLMIMMADFLIYEKKCRFLKARKAIICILIVIAAVPSANRYIETTKTAASNAASGNYSASWDNRFSTYEGLSQKYDGADLKYGYYAFDAKEHFFFKYMARK